MAGKIKLDFWKIFWLIVSLVFAVASFFIVLNAAGYRLNWRYLTIQKTGLLAVKTNPRGARVYLAGKLQKDLTPTRLPMLLPGWYDLRLEYTDYEDWEKTFYLDESEAKNFDNIILLLKQPKIVEEKILPEIFSTATENKDLLIKNNEIFQLKNDEQILLTRFSHDIKNADWLIDKEHLIYQLGKTLYAGEKDGSYQVKLYDSTDDFDFRLISDTEVAVKQGEKIIVLQIR